MQFKEESNVYPESHFRHFPLYNRLSSSQLVHELSELLELQV